LVTGAAGFIGSRLVDELLHQGYEVVGVDSFTDFYSPSTKRANLAAASVHDHFCLLEADLGTVDLDPLLRPMDAVFHLAGQPGVRASWGTSFETYLRQNVLVTQRLLEALARHPVPTVMASTSSVYGDACGEALKEDAPLQPVSPYGMTKASAEQLVEVYRRDLGLPVVALRYFSVFGPRQRPDMAFQRFIEAAETGQAIRVFGSGEQSRDFTFVGDVVAATIAALAGPSPIYNVGGGTPATVNQAISIIEQITGRDLRVVREGQARGDARHTWADTTLAGAELGWSPCTSLMDGLAAQLAECRARRRNLVTV
jgi:nucleoside-diphosphate-sugar epimerase